MPQYQRDHAQPSDAGVIGRIAASQFDLRAGVARIERTDQLAQRHEHRADGRRKHRTDLHVGKILTLPLVKADQHRTFLGDVAHRQPGAITVIPGRPFKWSQQRIGAHLAQVPQVVFEHPLLDGNLGGRVQMLHLAAAASPRMQPEMRAAGFHALRRFATDGAQRALFPVVLAALGVVLHFFERQRAFDEYHHAVGLVRDALGLEVERLDREPFVAGRRQRRRSSLGMSRFRHAADRMFAGRGMRKACATAQALSEAEGSAKGWISATADNATDRQACPAGESRNATSRDRRRCCPSRRSSVPSAPTGLPSRATTGCVRRP